MDNSYVSPSAVAYVRGGKDAPSLFGEIRFYDQRRSVLVIADIQNLPRTNVSGFFALHVHEGNSCSGEAFANTKNHYNPKDTPHPNHAGDLPPLLLCNGGAFMAVETDRFRVSDVIGRTVVIHSGPDDFTSQPSGNAGKKIACGLIRKA